MATIQEHTVPMSPIEPNKLTNIFDPLMEDIKSNKALPLAPIKSNKHIRSFLLALLMAGVDLQDAVNKAIMVTAGTTMEVMKSAQTLMDENQKDLQNIIDRIGKELEKKHPDSDKIQFYIQEYNLMAQKGNNTNNVNNSNMQEEQTNTTTLAQSQKQAIDFTNSAKDINSETSTLMSQRI